jgi:hypothetical protein
MIAVTIDLADLGVFEDGNVEIGRLFRFSFEP